MGWKNNGILGTKFNLLHDSNSNSRGFLTKSTVLHQSRLRKFKQFGLALAWWRTVHIQKKIIFIFFIFTEDKPAELEQVVEEQRKEMGGRQEGERMWETN